MSLDIHSILAGWPFEPGKLSVRRIVGDDGRDKIQLRLDLGLLQMEVDGRPDGDRPFGFESYLEYYQHQFQAARAAGDDAEGHAFNLDAEACRNLRHEAMMYYHRYLSLFALDDFEAVVRDTQRNLDALDFCRRWAADDEDRIAQEGYRPYVVMMRSRAGALDALKREDYDAAAAAVRAGIEEIAAFGEQIEQPEEVMGGAEVEILRALLEEIETRSPAGPLKTIENELKLAVQQERYEDAARLRDQLNIIRRNEDRH